MTRRILATGTGGVAALAAALAIVYVVVPCQSLPSYLGGVNGDTHPRTRLGAAILLLAALLALVAERSSRRRE